MPRTWNSQYPIFNDSIIQESEGSLEFSTKRFVARKAESRGRMSFQDYWVLDLSNLLLSPEQYEEILAFNRASVGMLKPVLVRNARECLLENAKDEPAFLGHGDGVQTVFQLVKQSSYQGRDFELVVEHPNYNYPPMEDLNKQTWTVLPELQIWLNGVEATTGWTVDRNTGEITFASGAMTSGKDVEATGGFYKKMLAPDRIPVKLDGPMFRVSSGIQFIEPFPGIEALLG